MAGTSLSVFFHALQGCEDALVGALLVFAERNGTLGVQSCRGCTRCIESTGAKAPHVAGRDAETALHLCFQLALRGVAAMHTSEGDTDGEQQLGQD